jgi:integrase
MATDARTIYLHKRGEVWHLKLAIPRAIRHLYLSANGKPRTHIEESLRTGDLTRANRAKHARLHFWQADFARKEREDAGELPHDIRDAHEARAALREAGDDDAAHAALDMAISQRTDEIEADAGTAQAKQWHALATQVDRPTLREAFDKWIETDQRAAGTKAQYRHAFAELLEYIGVADAMPEAVTRAKARAYVDWINTEAVSARGGPLAYETKQVRVVALSSFWTKYLERREHVPFVSNPWRGHELTGRKQANVDDDIKRPYTPEEMLTLIACPELGGDYKVRYPKRTLIELHALGFYTGARLDELCSRVLGDVEAIRGGYMLHIRRSKSPSGVRSIPILHPIPVAVLRRRINKRKDPAAQLFEEFKPGPEQHGAKMSFYPQKALGRLRDRLGFGPEVDFHSCRRNFATTMEAKRVYPPALVRYLVHNPPGLSFGLYAKGEDEALRDVARAVAYPAKVERAMRAALGIA